MMDETILYDRLQSSLQIDKLNLDEELVAMPQLIQDAGDATSTAIFRRDLSKHDVDIAVALAARDIRNEGNAVGKKPAEDLVKTESMLDPKVIRAQQDYENAKYELARWQALMDALRAKSSALKVVCELVISGYLTPSAITQQRREDINIKRRRLDD